MWLHLPGTVEPHLEKPPRLESIEVMSLVEALDNPGGDPPLPEPEWVGESVWMFTLGSIGRDGVSRGYRITFEAVA